ncbi:MAG: 3-keto-5-aminohexanoate cleavage protein [Proteobacteria bacterium]|nr:3-keto-5-aminohexanoate cleavage protein [Pseudomonadota bacterium]MDA1354830.1 3-keto-5-aminohexanoate cleavage protein [Pseudomonadota bacterium]
MARKVIITCAVTGSADTVGKNPAVPVTPQQIADSAIEAAKAGAAIVHVHVRDPETGQASMAPELYEATAGRIRESNTDVVLNLTTGYGGRISLGLDNPLEFGPGTTMTSPARRIEHVLALKPEICSLDVATMNSGGIRDESVMINSPPHLRYMAQAMRENGVVPELEVFDVGHVRLARHMLEADQIARPGFFQLCLGIQWGAPATPAALNYLLTLLPEGAHWAAFGISRDQLPLAGLSILSGGHVRTGLEDNLYLRQGELAPSNAALVEQAVTLIEMFGCEAATPAEARDILNLRKP